MSLESAKIILCIVINLTVCQYTQSRFTLSLVVSESRSVTYDNSSDAIAVDAYNDKTINIVGGSTTVMKSPGYPYMAYVVHNFNLNGTLGDCGGTILSKRWVLTAASCVIKYPQTRRFLVVFGISNRSVIELDILRGPGVSMITTNTFIHKEYGRPTKHMNDIALLLMPEDIPFSIDIQPIKLTYYDERFVNKDAHLIGWRNDNAASKYTTRLKHITLPIIENNVCKQYWHDYISDRHICTAGGLGKGSCEGDGGGPLIVVQNSQVFQIGIVSYGGKCPSNFPDVYTKVSSYIGWIREVMTLHGENEISNISITLH